MRSGVPAPFGLEFGAELTDHPRVRRDLPAGTVTFLFTDVEGSTGLLHELGAGRYGEALAAHRRVVREACSAHAGVEVDTQGDAFFVAFPTAPGALAAARGITEGLGGGPIRVRIGLHTGTALVTDEGYVGADVHRAARVAAAGHGGQILVSSSAAALLREHRLRDLGEHRFKDLAAPERLYQFGEDDFPSVKSLYRTNLPVPATPFLGREQEVSEVVAALARDDVRLLTLTGPGGTGKTRLALQAVAEASDGYPDGIFWVPLAALRDPALLLPAAAEACEVKEGQHGSVAEDLVRELTGKRVLVLVDNVEHLLPRAASELAQLQRAAGLVLVATSRERLQLQGEHVYPVGTFAPADSVELFVARARGITPGFHPGEVVPELCARLDHLPLALELAAARTVLFTPRQLLERISQRLDLLRGGRDADPRQQTLRATIEWSYDLLDPEEQRVFRELSVFAGGCTYEAAEEICEADPDTLQALLDRSLLRRRDGSLGPRYWMLETIREFGDEQLAASDELERLRNRHLKWYAAAAAALGRASRAYDEEAHAFLRDEQPNIGAALEWALETRAATHAQQILVGAWFYWMISGLAAQGDAWARQIVALDVPPSADRAEALALAGEFPRHRGEPARALELKERSIAMIEQLGLEDQVAATLAATYTDAADAGAQLGDFDRAVAYAERALAIRRAQGGELGIAHALNGAGLLAEQRGAPDEAVPLYEEAIDLLERAGLTFELAAVLEGLGSAKRKLGDLEGARAALEEAVRRAEDIGDRPNAAMALGTLGLVAADAGEPARAAELLLRAHEEARAVGLPLPEEVELTLARLSPESGRSTASSPQR